MNHGYDHALVDFEGCIADVIWHRSSRRREFALVVAVKTVGDHDVQVCAKRTRRPLEPAGECGQPWQLDGVYINSNMKLCASLDPPLQIQTLK